MTASADADADLFWAIRGAAATSASSPRSSSARYPVATVLRGPVVHPLEAAPELLGFYRDFSAQAPDELSMQAAFLHAPDGSGAKLCGVAICHCGERRRPSRGRPPPAARVRVTGRRHDRAHSLPGCEHRRRRAVRARAALLLEVGVLLRALGRGDRRARRRVRAGTQRQVRARDRTVRRRGRPRRARPPPRTRTANRATTCS